VYFNTYKPFTYLYFLYKFGSILSLRKNLLANSGSARASEHGGNENYELTTFTSTHSEVNLLQSCKFKKKSLLEMKHLCTTLTS